MKFLSEFRIAVVDHNTKTFELLKEEELVYFLKYHSNVNFDQEWSVVGVNVATELLEDPKAKLVLVLDCSVDTIRTMSTPMYWVWPVERAGDWPEYEKYQPCTFN